MTTKQIIKQTFISLYQTHSIQSITITKLCKKANIARTTFYAYYDSIEEVLIEIRHELLLELNNIDYNALMNPLNKDYEISPFSTVDTLRYLKQNQFFFTVLLEKDSYMIEKVKKHIAHHVEDTVQSIKTTSPKQFIKDYITGGMLNAILSWLHDDHELTPEQMSSFMIDSIQSNIHFFQC